jgi:hypothetical protein
VCVIILSLLFLEFCIVVAEIQHLLINEHDGEKNKYQSFKHELCISMYNKSPLKFIVL